MNSSTTAAQLSFFKLLKAAHALEERLETSLAEVGLSSAKFGALNQLVLAREPLSLSDLAARVACVRSNITQLVDRLEGDGLVRRISDPDDRRSVRAEVTPLGMERHSAGATRVDAIQKGFAESIGEVDKDALERALTALRT
ncbi:MAG: MarR family winged helix-turn-helix transcriptional regulator [Gemmatimonadales bacterium]